MKKTLLFLSCVALTWASCHSPEERAAMKAAADSAAHGKTETPAPAAPAETSGDTAAAPKADTTAAPVEPNVGPPVVTSTETPPTPKQEKFVGEGLIQKSDCLACHNVSKKIVGPAYKAVAAKYESSEANIDMLADKIIAGGSGVWGAVPMSPHPALSKADAREMAKYILSLKK